MVAGKLLLAGKGVSEVARLVGVNGGPKVRRGAAQKCATRVQEYPALRRGSRVSFNLWSDAA